jgi:hypothetical protein
MAQLPLPNGTKAPPYNNPRFGDEAGRYARKVARIHAADLPEDVQEEVVNEAIMHLLAVGPRGLETKSGIALFREAIKKAIRTTRAKYAAAGQRTRRAGESQFGKVAAEQVESIVVTIDGDADQVEVNLDAVPHPAAGRAIAELEVQLDLDRIMAVAPPNIETALRLIHVEEHSVQGVAAMQGMSRFKLYRKIDNFCAPWRLAA